MRYDKLEGNRRTGLDVPRLDGGWNTRDEAGMIEDSQLAACSNLWWKEEALRTRPGIGCGTEQTAEPEADAYVTLFQYAGEDGGAVDGRRVVIAAGYKDGSATNWDYTPAVLSYDGRVTPTSQTVRMPYEPGQSGGNALLVEYDRQELGRLIGNREFDGGLMLISEGYMFALPAHADQYPVRMDNYLYKPLVRRAGKGVAERGSDLSVTGEAVEDYNLATPYFRMAFTTDGEATAFYLPQTELDDTRITAAYTDGTGRTTVHEILSESDIGTVQGGLVLHCDRAAGCVYFTDSGGTPAAPAKGTADNLVVTAAKSRAEFRRILYQMRFAVWYGGNSGFSPGGARLFLAGNPRYPNRVQWSAPGNPLYFPENSYMTVGDASQPVTALAVQGDLLAIFKERELHAASYTPSRVSAGEAAAFTVEKLRSAVGCDRPETIALCGNRLVWTHSGGAVYTLLSAAKGVGCLSGPIERELAESAYEEASAAVFDGHYLLLLGNTAYLLRLDEGYHRYTIPEGREDLKWMKWDFGGLGVSFRRILARDGRFVLEGYAARASDGATVRFFFSSTAAGNDTVLEIPEGPVFGERPVPYHLETKAYAFGERDTEKRVRRVTLSLAAEPIHWRLSYRTEKGRQDAPPIPLPPADGRVTLRPCLGGCRRMSLLAEGAGPAGIRGLALEADIYRGK